MSGITEEARKSGTPLSLQIVDDESLALRGRGEFNRKLAWGADSDASHPRALRGLSHIIEGDLCHRCGSCVGICPTNVLGLDHEGYPTVEALSACTDCDLCVKVCPGDEFDYHAAHRERFGCDGDLESPIGQFDHAVLAYATQNGLRDKATSGGLVTALLLHLLDTQQIDGAIVIVSDEQELWKGKPIVARTREEILASTKSKYAISPTNSVFSEIREIPGRYALVGLPCQIHGYVKAAALDERICERIVLTIGLFCHAAIEHEAFEIIWDALGDKGSQATKFISRVGKHPGAPHIVFQDGSMEPVYFGDKRGFKPSSMEMINILYRLYTPARCLTCFDGLAEFADIAVGDPWMAPPDDDIDFGQGWTFAFVRTERGKRAMGDLTAAEGAITKALTHSEALGCNKSMSTEKRWRAFRVIETQRRQGKPIPAYGPSSLALPSHKGKQFVLTEGHMLTHIFCFLPRSRAKVLRFMLSNGGYALLWINNKRRIFKFWVRDSIAWMKRRIYGRR